MFNLSTEAIDVIITLSLPQMEYVKKIQKLIDNGGSKREIKKHFSPTRRKFLRK